MMFEAEYRKRVNNTYSNMTTRAKPRLWKNGKNKGKVRVPGLQTLPFFRDELWAHVREQIPEGGALCPYCRDHGYTANIIYLDTFVLDHHVPLKHGGSWDLSNLICICPGCNRTKGAMSYTAFIVLVRDFLPDLEMNDQKYVISCLRTHGLALRGGFGKTTPTTAKTAPPVNLQRRLEDEF